MGSMQRLVISTLLLTGAITTSQACAHGTVGVQSTGDRAIQFPDTATRQTLVVDLHTHSAFSDGHVWPGIRIEEALKDGLDAIAITEHLEWQPHLEDIPHPDRNRSYEIASASLPADSVLIVIPGTEITRSAPYGHMNAVFVKDANRLHRPGIPTEPFDPVQYFRSAGEWPAQAALDEAKSQGAFVFWNHSWSDFSTARTEMTEFHRANAAAGRLHGIEIANGDTYSAESFQIALDHDLTLIGVSDVHNLIDWDYEPHKGGHRPVNLVFTSDRSADGIRDALMAGHTVVWFENLLVGRTAELLPLLEACLSIASQGFVEGRDILEVTLANHSDARFQLRNLSGLTFTSDHDVVEVAPHSETELRIRTPRTEDALTLRFEVLNALIAPGVHPQVSLTAAIPAAVAD
ncbi:MAG: Sb-PDE family phosphodiesterase [Pseudomonadales bacterium]|nr:hypothetical protein [Pseudomonadales bacterium]